MSRLSGRFRRFLGDISGVVTTEWVAVTSVFLIVGIFITYQIFGDNEAGMIAIVDGQTGKLAERVDDVDNLLTEVNSWSQQE